MKRSREDVTAKSECDDPIRDVTNRERCEKARKAPTRRRVGRNVEETEWCDEEKYAGDDMAYG